MIGIGFYWILSATIKCYLVGDQIDSKKIIILSNLSLNVLLAIGAGRTYIKLNIRLR